MSATARRLVARSRRRAHQAVRPLAVGVDAAVADATTPALDRSLPAPATSVPPWTGGPGRIDAMTAVHRGPAVPPSPADDNLDRAATAVSGAPPSAAVSAALIERVASVHAAGVASPPGPEQEASPPPPQRALGVRAMPVVRPDNPAPPPEAATAPDPPAAEAPSVAASSSMARRLEVEAARRTTSLPAVTLAAAARRPDVARPAPQPSPGLAAATLAPAGASALKGGPTPRAVTPPSAPTRHDDTRPPVVIGTIEILNPPTSGPRPDPLADLSDRRRGQRRRLTARTS